MSHAKALYQWEERLASHFPQLSRARRTWLAWVSFGLVLAKSALLNQVVLHLALALGQSFNSLRQRLRRLYQPHADPQQNDQSFNYTSCFGPLLRWVTAGFTERRLALAIDPTNLGSRFTILTVSVVLAGCAVPVAWHVQAGDAPGSWNAQWKRLLGLLHTALGDGWQVLVLSDRGLESKTLFAAIVDLGWHPLMRVKKAGHFRPAGWVKGWTLGRLAARIGARWKGRGVAWPSSSHLSCTLLACWESGHEDAWLVLTDWAPAASSVSWYAWRSWIEHGFRDLKSDGWQLSKTRMTDPERVARWWTAAALATLWVLETGEQVQQLQLPATRTHQGPAAGPVHSWFTVGLAELGLRWGRGRIGPWHRLQQPHWPRDARTNDRLREQDWLDEHQRVPL